MADDQVLTDLPAMVERSPGVLALRVCVIEPYLDRGATPTRWPTVASRAAIIRETNRSWP
ncbi:hypothetical protein ACFU44_24515 [Nocardia rhizosphaerihabitans]|uniref:hypothetical protein n=1 Tax=Nocardia rhizosphaerihabitans TaxID=1691570 RepID=UPI0036721815